MSEIIIVPIDATDANPFRLTSQYPAGQDIRGGPYAVANAIILHRHKFGEPVKDMATSTTATAQFLRRPTMVFGECYEFLEVVLPFAQPQKAVRSREVHVSHLHQLHGRRPEAGRNKR